MRAAEATTMQQTSAEGAQARADAAARLRQAVEQAREAQAEARNAAREAQRAGLEAARQAEAAQGTGLQVPPPPERVIVQNGRVIVGPNGGGEYIAGQGGLPPGFPTDIPPTAANIAYMFFVTLAVIAIGVPLARAFGRWLDRRGAVAPTMPSDVATRLDRIEQAIETVAVEVERISEGQRFTSRLMAEMRQLPQLEGTRAEGARIPEPRR